MTKDQIFEIARKWGMFAAGLPQIEGFALDVIAASACGSAEPVAWVYCDTLHAEHCHLSDQEAINDGWLPLVYARHAGFAREDIRELAVKCGFKYWRASDAHGVTSSIAEAESLLADLLGVEVEIGGGKAVIADTAGAKQQLSNLLARIHRDGGHYESEHGTNKAVDDADTIVAELNAAADAARARSKAIDKACRWKGEHWPNDNPEWASEVLSDKREACSSCGMTMGESTLLHAIKQNAENRPAIDAAPGNSQAATKSHVHRFGGSSVRYCMECGFDTETLPHPPYTDKGAKESK